MSACPIVRCVLCPACRSPLVVHSYRPGSAAIARRRPDQDALQAGGGIIVDLGTASPGELGPVRLNEPEPANPATNVWMTTGLRQRPMPHVAERGEEDGTCKLSLVC